MSYLFVDFDGTFRLAKYKPSKFKIRKPILFYTDEKDDCYGRSYLEYYYIPGEEVEYWAYDKIDEPHNWSMSNPSTNVPSIPTIGTYIPKSLLNDKYLKMTCKDNPVSIE